MIEMDMLFDLPRRAYALRCCPVCGQALCVSATHTYFVERQGWVKIGATSNPRRRINELRRPAWTKHLLSPAEMDWHEPLTVLAVLEGDVEHALHEAFAHLHVVGEWFLPDAQMAMAVGL